MDALIQKISDQDHVKPRCSVFGICGGCQLQDMSYTAQVAWKQQVVLDQLQRIGKIKTPNVLPTVAAQPWNYRARITLHCDRHGKIGFYKEGTHDAVEFDECPIAAKEINSRLADEKKKIAGKPGHYEVRLDNGSGFTQVNPAQNKVLQDLLHQGLAGRTSGQVVELFCGDGNFSFVLAPLVGKLYSCDSFEASIQQAIARAKTDHIKNIQFTAAPAQRYMRDLQQQGIKPDGILLDPPRRGAPEIIPALIEMGPQWICYISCNPSTLARDIKELCRGSGYTLESAQPVDMFPQTAHVETICWLSR